jgi:transcriptional regulator with XRE-family HTH domain
VNEERTTMSIAIVPSGSSLQRTLRAHLISERAQSRLSQADLADRAGVSRYTIVRLESGDYANPGLELLGKIAGALCVGVHDLLAPIEIDMPSDAELERRAAAPRSEFIDADALLAAIDEADGRRRYSNRGRRRVER